MQEKQCMPYDINLITDANVVMGFGLRLKLHTVLVQQLQPQILYAVQPNIRGENNNPFYCSPICIAASKMLIKLFSDVLDVSAILFEMFIHFLNTRYFVHDCVVHPCIDSLKLTVHDTRAAFKQYHIQVIIKINWQKCRYPRCIFTVRCNL